MRVVKEMGLTAADFLRHVPAALPRGCHIEDGRVRAAGVVISYEELSPRRLSALVSLPRLKVTIDADAAVVRRFEQVFQRGGG